MSSSTSGSNKRLILVMGATGTGKSSFINLLVDAEHEVKVSARGAMEPCTKQVAFPQFQWGGFDVIMVDTVGSDHWLDDADDDNTDNATDDTDAVQKLVASCLNFSAAGQKISGIVYLHDITKPRVGQSEIESLERFNAVAGPDAMKNVVFLTNHWSRPPHPDTDGDRLDQVARESTLQTQFWTVKIEGARNARFERLDDKLPLPECKERALEILKPMLQHPLKTDLRVISEYHAAPGERKLIQTSLGKYEDKRLDKIITKQERRNKTQATKLRNHRARLAETTDEQMKCFALAAGEGARALGAYGLEGFGSVAGAMWGAIGEGAVWYAGLFERGSGGMVRGEQERMWKRAGDRAKEGADFVTKIPFIPTKLGGLIGGGIGLGFGLAENVGTGAKVVAKSWVEPPNK